LTGTRLSAYSAFVEAKVTDPITTRDAALGLRLRLPLLLRLARS
jgi:hypothetical protein